jgi:hypothetical protein
MHIALQFVVEFSVYLSLCLMETYGDYGLRISDYICIVCLLAVQCIITLRSVEWAVVTS